MSANGKTSRCKKAGKFPDQMQLTDWLQRMLYHKFCVQSKIRNWFWDQSDMRGNGYSGRIISLSLTRVHEVPAFKFLFMNKLATGHVLQLNAPVN